MLEHLLKSPPITRRVFLGSVSDAVILGLCSSLAEATSTRKLPDYPLFDNKWDPQQQGLIKYIQNYVKPVLMTIGAYWCPPCVKDVDAFNTIQELFAEHLQVLGINILVSDEREDSIQKTNEEIVQRAKYPNRFMRGSDTAKLLGYLGKDILQPNEPNLPCHVLVNNAADILYVQFHGLNYTPGYVVSDEYFKLVRRFRDILQF